MLRVGIIGFGGIAKNAHSKHYYDLEARNIAKLVAVCDIRPERFNEKIQMNINEEEAPLPDSVKRYSDYKEMLKIEKLDMVDICLPTYLHQKAAVMSLEAGCHVLCEKPMSLNYDLCKNMCDTAKRVGKKLMIGQCNRFSVPHLYLKKLVDDQTYGTVKSVFFHRFSTPPVWGWDNWFMDKTRSGGAILDLHIHDIDYARFVFGNPKSVSCCTADIFSGRDIIHSRLMYDNFSVMAVCDWSREKLPFETGCTINFEKAVVSRLGSKVTVKPFGEEAFEPELKLINFYKAEIEYFINCIINNKEIIDNAPEDSALSVKLIDTLAESAERNGEFIKFGV